MCIEKIFLILEYKTGLLKTGHNDRYALLVTFVVTKVKFKSGKYEEEKFHYTISRSTTQT